MFFGTTPQVVSQFVAGELRRANPDRAFVPYAGNFVIEQLCGIVDPKMQVHSTDISLYSRGIGYALTDTTSEIRVTPKVLEDFPMLEGDDPMTIGTAVIFLAEVGKMYEKQHVPYYQNLLRDSIANADKYLEKIRLKLQAVKDTMGDLVFYGTDGVPMSRTAKEGDFLFYDPPVLLGDYEKMFAPLEDCFAFIEPDYTQMDEEVKQKDLEYFNEQGVRVLYRRNTDEGDIPDGYEEVFRYRYKYNASYCVYSNMAKSRKWVGIWSPLREKVLNLPILSKDDEITSKSKLEVIPVESGVGNHYRLMWVKKAQMQSIGHSFLVMIDDKVAGMLCIDSGLAFGSELAQLISDPATPTTKYKRLGKLMIMLASTHEMLERYNEMTMWEHNGFTTRVFTNAPVSMKYRGIFNLADRQEDEDGDYKFKLYYHNRTSEGKFWPTYKAALKEWHQKYAKVTI